MTRKSEAEILEDVTARLNGYHSINEARSSVLAWTKENRHQVSRYTASAEKNGCFRIFNEHGKLLTISVDTLKRLCREAGLP